MMRVIGHHSRLLVQGTMFAGGTFAGICDDLAVEESTAQTSQTMPTKLIGTFHNLHAYEIPPPSLNRDRADTTNGEIGNIGGTLNRGNARNSGRERLRQMRALKVPVGDTPELEFSNHTAKTLPDAAVTSSTAGGKTLKSKPATTVGGLGE